MDIEANHDSACGLRADGSFRCWGNLMFDTRGLLWIGPDATVAPVN